MRVRFWTRSGSFYTVDSTKLTWERISDHPILGRGNAGNVKYFTPVVVGSEYVIMSYDSIGTLDPIRTTIVTRAELA